MRLIVRDADPAADQDHALGLLAGTLHSAQADRWPADLWERLDREPA